MHWWVTAGSIDLTQALQALAESMTKATAAVEQWDGVYRKIRIDPPPLDVVITQHRADHEWHGGMRRGRGGKWGRA